MNPPAHSNVSDDMRPEYDFSRGVRGKHYQAYRAGTNVVLLEPDVAEVFTDSRMVNEVLRLLVKLARTSLPSNDQPDKILHTTKRSRRKIKTTKQSRN